MPRPALYAALLVVALALGCGDDDSGSDDRSNPPPKKPPAAAAPPAAKPPGKPAPPKPIPAEVGEAWAQVQSALACGEMPFVCACKHKAQVSAPLAAVERWVSEHPALGASRVSWTSPAGGQQTAHALASRVAELRRTLEGCGDPAFEKAEAHRVAARSRAAEARALLRTMYSALASHVDAHGDGRSPGELIPRVGPTPKKPRCEAASWPDDAPDGWARLGFRPRGRVRFSYEITPGPSPAQFILRARGDVDCDGELSSYVLRGHIEDGRAIQDGPIEADAPLE